MSAYGQIASLLRLASEDLRGARLLASHANRNAIYLCSQAAEKVIRAVLLAEGKHAGIRHHLDEMVDQIPAENPIKRDLEKVQKLGAFATSFRYPTPGGRIPAHPGVAEFEAHATAVEAVLRASVAWFQVDLAGKAQAGRVTPIR